MKTGQPEPTGYRRLVSNSTTAGTASTAAALNGVVIGGNPTDGAALIANGSNSASWASNVSKITANGSNVLGPIVNFANGSNISLSAASNTITISASGGGGVPYYIAPTETFTVPLYTQALFAMTIDNEGTLDTLGFLIEVD